MRCKACNDIMTDRELTIDEEFCSRCLASIAEPDDVTSSSGAFKEFNKMFPRAKPKRAKK
jgi:hypothetical protein